MSNIYIQEPPTNGKVLLATSVGDIDIELWSKEAPKACRNFVQLCMEGYYHGTIFHRVVKDFIVQGGDPTGTGHGGESIWGKPFKDEIHSRLRFVRRGLVAMANAGKHDNGSQFFFTLASTPELMNKHTIFGKVTGNTVYNMLKLSDADTDENDRPRYPMKILKTKVLASPFDDIAPRTDPSSAKSEESKKKKNKSKATKNFKLLSFGEEAEADEEETEDFTKNLKGKGKGKSSHDLLDDEKLSHVPAVEPVPEKRKQEDSEQEDEETKQEKEDMKERIKKKLKKEEPDDANKKPAKETAEPKKLSRSEQLKQEVKELKRELMQKKKEQEQKESKQEEEEDEDEPVDPNDVVASYKKEKKKYKDLKKTQAKKGAGRESATMALLEKFQSKLRTAQQFGEYNEEVTEKDLEQSDAKREEGEEEEEGTDMSWMSHKLEFEGAAVNKVLDANITDVDRYSIVDPRNPLNQRRREASKQSMKAKR